MRPRADTPRELRQPRREMKWRHDVTDKMSAVRREAMMTAYERAHADDNERERVSRRVSAPTLYSAMAKMTLRCC